MQALLVLVTGPDADQAATLAKTMVEERLAACGNVIPGLRSIYRWQGVVKDDPEALLLLKTTPDSYAALEKRIQELHPYEVPEILAFPSAHGLAGYLQWVSDEVA